MTSALLTLHALLACNRRHRRRDQQLLRQSERRTRAATSGRHDHGRKEGVCEEGDGAQWDAGEPSSQ